LSTQYATSYLNQLIFADRDTSIQLPDPTKTGGPLAIGAKFTVEDNLGRAGAANIAIVGPINGGTTGVSITTAYSSIEFTWVGSTYTQINGP
jgi:hypothetical protein